jgi:Zn-finger nucleic acid-binding protein
VNTCPKCHRELARVTYEGVELLKCSHCQGFWFKNGAFRRVKQIGFAGFCGEASDESPGEGSSEAQTAEDLLCPDCSIPLSEYAYAYSSDIHLHRCSQCKGIWADCLALVAIDQLLNSYQESLDEAKAKAIPLMLEVKEQIQREELARKEEQKFRKKRGLFNRLFGKKEPQQKTIEDIFEDFHTDSNDQS